MLDLMNVLLYRSNKGNKLRFPIGEFTATNMISGRQKNVCVPFSVHYHPSRAQTSHPSKTKQPQHQYYNK